jgi:predicted AAA+ superfamily ATPase
MLKTVKQACKFNPVIQDYRMSQGIENLADLINDAGDGTEFFSRNYVTHGMEQLFREGMLRLSGKSDQAVFELTQAMGGGKTHMMIALGLLAKHAHLRPDVLPADLSERLDFGNARIAAFNGRNNPDNYIWGDIATQLGEAEKIKPHWINGPKSVDQQKWKEIIGDQPTLIMIDELPPYLDVASTQSYGAGTLATMVVYSLSTLMSAALELPNCCIVIANLSGSYNAQTKLLKEAISNLQQETRRQSMTITPVQLSGNEIYEILKKRLIDELPDEQTISDVAEEYAQQIKKAEDGGYIVASSIEQITEQVRETYPFHPSFKHLVALFKESEGFRQTRGLMQFTARLLKSVAQRETDDVFLIGTQHLDLNDEQVKDEIERISPKLIPAVTRDIADKGDAIAETIDTEQSNDSASQLMTILLASSLSRAVGGRIGLSESEIIEFLAAPNRKADEFLDALQKLREQAWYLHREDQRFFIKETENLSRQIERNAKEIPQPKIDQALINRLKGILQPVRRNVYQELQVLPRMDELKLSGPRVLIVIKPDGKVPPSELINFFEFQQEKNNLLVLTGQDSIMADAVEDRLRELYAIEQIEKRLKAGDTLFEEARDRLEEAEGRFIKALSAAYNTILFPGIDEMDGSERLLKVTIDNGLKVGEGEQSAEAQIENLMGDPRANYKLAADLKNDFGQYFAMAESELWPSGADNRRTPWKDVVNRAKCNPGWPWMPGSSGMDTLKTEALKQGRWRLGEDGYIEKGPFPKEKTSVNVSLLGSNPETGESIISLTPRNAGESPIIFYSTKPEVLETDPKIDDLENFSTAEGSLYFKVADPTGKYETGPAIRWIAELKVRHQIEPSADKRKVTLQCTPKADMFYTLDGSNPKDGLPYTAPFEVGSDAARLLVYAKSGEATKTADFQIPHSGDKTVHIDDTKPARLSSDRRIPLDTTDKVFTVINRFKDQANTRFKGVRIEIGEGENTVGIRFGERHITAAMIEATVNSLRDVLKEADANISIAVRDGIDFENGFEAKEFAKLVGIELKPGDIAQDE